MISMKDPAFLGYMAEQEGLLDTPLSLTVQLKDAMNKGASLYDIQQEAQRLLNAGKISMNEIKEVFG